jgi:hypothetical protein
LVGIAKRHHRKLQRKTANFQHAALHAVGDLAEVRITGCQLRPGIADADHRAAVEQMRRQALVLHPRAMHHAVDARPAEPVITTQFFLCGHYFSLPGIDEKFSTRRTRRDEGKTNQGIDSRPSIHRTRCGIFSSLPITNRFLFSFVFLRVLRVERT